MTSYRFGGVLLAATTLLSTVLTGTATADYSASTLTLSVEEARGTLGTARLECRPAGGSHPNPAHACADVATAEGDLDSLPGSPSQISCTMENRPVVATARGWWHGEPVRWQHQYPNPCTLLSRTGVVFDF